MHDDRGFWLWMAALVLIITLTMLFIFARAEALIPAGEDIPGPDSANAAIAPVAGMETEAPWGEVATKNLPPGMYADTAILNNGGDGNAAD